MFENEKLAQRDTVAQQDAGGRVTVGGVGMGFEAAAVQHALQRGAAGAGKGGFLRAGSAFETRRADVGEMVATA